jgi:membrane protein
MAFYHFLAIFPCLLIFLAIAAGVPSIGPGVRSTASSLIQQVLPNQAAELLQQMAAELQRETPTGFELLLTFAGAMWAAMNGTWALVFGVNYAYEVEENRAWWKLGLTIAGLTIALTVASTLALLLLFSAAQLQAHIWHNPSAVALRILDWLAVLALLMICFAIVYRFAPNIKDAKWKWSTPGSLCALSLWVISTVALRFYFAHITNYHRTYGHLNTVVMLLLWLYLTNAAILVGAEMNSEIEKAAAQGQRP